MGQERRDEKALRIWQEKIETNGITSVRLEVSGLSSSQGLELRTGTLAIAEFERKQALEAERARSDREIETLKVATDANDIAEATKKEMRWTWAVGAGVAIVVAWLF